MICEQKRKKMRIKNFPPPAAKDLRLGAETEFGGLQNILWAAE